MATGGTDDRIAASCPYCGAPVMLEPPTWQSPAAGWCWRCNNPVELGAPKQEPERDAWVIELHDATAEQVTILTDAATWMGIEHTRTRGTVTGCEAKEIMQLVAKQEGFTKTEEGYNAAAKWVEDSARAKGVMEVTDNE